MSRLKSSIFAVLIAAAVVGISGVITAPPVEAQGSAALSISPRKNYTIEPGKSVEDTLLIRNLDREQALNLTLRVVDFTYNDDSGTPKLMLDENAPQTPWSLKPFLTIPRNVTIEAGESASIDMSVAIPAEQGAGSYYSAIVYSSSAADGGNVGLSASGVTLAFTSVPGEVNEKLILEKLGAYNSEKNKYQIFNIDMPVRIGYTLKNEGNVAESPVGSITLRSIFGKETVINDVNPNQSLALIGQTRTFLACIKQTSQEVDFSGSRQEATTCSDDTGIWPGIYRVEMNGYYGWNGNATQEIVGKAWMVYTPWWFIVAAAAVLAIVAYHGWRIVRFFRSRQGGPRKKSITRGRR